MKNENKKEMLKKDRNEKLQTILFLAYGVILALPGCVALHICKAFAIEENKDKWQKRIKKAWLGFFCLCVFLFARCTINTQKELERIQTEETLNKVFGNIGKNY